MINLNKRQKDLRKFIDVLENTIICLLKNFSIESSSYRDRVGIWVTEYKGKKLKRERKIGAIGLRIKKWTTYHGLSFNINPDLNYYKNIQACGLSNFSAISLKELGINLTTSEFDELFINIFLKKLKNFK